MKRKLLADYTTQSCSKCAKPLGGNLGSLAMHEKHCGNGTELFWSKIKKRGGCWIYPTTKVCRVQGLVGENIGAPKFAWLITYGPVDVGLFVKHRCGNPACVRPEHLYLSESKK